MSIYCFVCLMSHHHTYPTLSSSSPSTDWNGYLLLASAVTAELNMPTQAG
jgi:hypothetical protein